MTSIVLIADDESFTRLDLVDTLNQAGYETLEATSADEAWEMLLEREEVCCLFTDIQMPGRRDGLQLAQDVKARWPNKIVVIGSGHLRPITLPAGAVFLPKPYSHERVVRVIGDLHRRGKG